MTKIPYTQATPEAGKEFYMNAAPGEVIMLNLLQFKDAANYNQTPNLTPAKPISGKEAYQLYINHTFPLLKGIGSEVIFYGKTGSFLIGPTDEKWDAMLLIRHSSVKKFIDFAADENYLKGVGHRTAALQDSRLLPMVEQELFPK